jgi:uncharacterized protein (TIGR00255 family)
MTMHSMTGFGHVEKALKEARVVVDVKTVNGRFLDFNVRLPREVAGLEAEIRAEVQARIVRGRVDVLVNVHPTRGEQGLNEAAVESYLALTSKLSARGVEGVLNVGTLLQLPGVIAPQEVDYSSEEFVHELRSVLVEALEQVIKGRKAEGDSLKKELKDRVAALKAQIKGIGANSESIRDHYFHKLKQKLNEAGVDAGLDENRLIQELIYYAERSDITEELTRLRSHLDRMNHYLAQSDSGASGKQLDFLCQEMNREVNTILSKSPLADVSQFGVEAKAEIEKIREQVQNVE